MKKRNKKSFSVGASCAAVEPCKFARARCSESGDPDPSKLKYQKQESGIVVEKEKAWEWLPDCSKDVEGKETEFDDTHEEELCGLFEAVNSLCQLNDRCVKIEAVMDSGASESVALCRYGAWFRCQNDRVRSEVRHT